MVANVITACVDVVLLLLLVWKANLFSHATHIVVRLAHCVIAAGVAFHIARMIPQLDPYCPLELLHAAADILLPFGIILLFISDRRKHGVIKE